LCCPRTGGSTDGDLSARNGDHSLADVSASAISTSGPRSPSFISGRVVGSARSFGSPPGPNASHRPSRLCTSLAREAWANSISCASRSWGNGRHLGGSPKREKRSASTSC
jgi:hypothetical protein